VVALAVMVALVLGAVAWAANVPGDWSDWYNRVRTQVLELHGGNMQITRATTDTSDYVVAAYPGFGISGGLGKHPVVQEMNPVAALSATAVHAAIAIPTGVGIYTDTASGITNPDVYRALTITGSAAAALSDVVITGTNWAGNVRTTTITGTGAATVQGLWPFATVTNIRIYGVAAPGGATFSVGYGENLGLYQPIAADADVGQIDTIAAAGVAWVVTAGGGLPAGAAASATYGTVDPETTITAADGYLIYYNASAW